jgi:hypothetical protein
VRPAVTGPGREPCHSRLLGITAERSWVWPGVPVHGAQENGVPFLVRLSGRELRMRQARYELMRCTSWASRTVAITWTIGTQNLVRLADSLTRSAAYYEANRCPENQDERSPEAHRDALSLPRVRASRGADDAVMAQSVPAEGDQGFQVELYPLSTDSPPGGPISIAEPPTNA